jgi:hypothetical protein
MDFQCLSVDSRLPGNDKLLWITVKTGMTNYKKIARIGELFARRDRL